jgi:hypothetical protein
MAAYSSMHVGESMFMYRDSGTPPWIVDCVCTGALPGGRLCICGGAVGGFGAAIARGCRAVGLGRRGVTGQLAVGTRGLRHVAGPLLEGIAQAQAAISASWEEAIRGVEEVRRPESRPGVEVVGRGVGQSRETEAEGVAGEMATCTGIGRCC